MLLEGCAKIEFDDAILIGLRFYCSANRGMNDKRTKRQRIEHLIERGDRLATAQEEQTDSLSDTTCASSLGFTPRRSSWTSQEDAKLGELVQQLGHSNWSEIASHFPSRDRKRCRERFVNHLAPSITTARTWATQDDEKLLQLHRSMGSKWTKMAQEFNGKSAENVKNRCLMLARKRDKTQEGQRRAPPQRWTTEEKEKLRTLVHTHGARNWLFIASQVPGRTDLQCLQQWYRTLDDQVVRGKGTWTQSEDRILVEKVAEIGRKWTEVAVFLPGRIGNQCRERFLNHLDPAIKMTPWTDDEETILTTVIEAHSTQWSMIAAKLPGRCENAIKNHWYSRERRRMLAESLVSESPTTPEN